jgi:hypothetical protein
MKIRQLAMISIVILLTYCHCQNESKASISKQTKQHILQAFNKIKEITHGET